MFYPLLHFSSILPGSVRVILGEEVRENSCVQGQARAALSSIPEFFLDSLLILAFQIKQPIHIILKYARSIGNVRSSLCREGGTQVTLSLEQGAFTAYRHKLHRHEQWATKPICPHLP